jgi:hypothetical protein
MITLLADRPAAAHAAQLEQFGRLAGLWSMHITYDPPDGSPGSRATGTWEFGYALDGRAVIDVWQVPGRDTLAGAPRAADQECGLCVRIWDPCLQLWRFTFHGTAHGHLIHMYAREIDDEIVMEQAQGGDLIRWIFSDIQPESFRWRSQRSTDGGASWRLEQQVRADRAAAPAAAGDLLSLDAV